VSSSYTSKLVKHRLQKFQQKWSGMYTYAVCWLLGQFQDMLGCVFNYCKQLCLHLNLDNLEECLHQYQGPANLIGDTGCILCLSKSTTAGYSKSNVQD